MSDTFPDQIIARSFLSHLTDYLPTQPVAFVGEVNDSMGIDVTLYLRGEPIVAFKVSLDGWDQLRNDCRKGGDWLAAVAEQTIRKAAARDGRPL